MNLSENSGVNSSLLSWLNEELEKSFESPPPPPPPAPQVMAGTSERGACSNRAYLEIPAFENLNGYFRTLSDCAIPAWDHVTQGTDFMPAPFQRLTYAWDVYRQYPTNNDPIAEPPSPDRTGGDYVHPDRLEFGQSVIGSWEERLPYINTDNNGLQRIEGMASIIGIIFKKETNII